MLSAVFTVQLVCIFQRLPCDKARQQVLVQDKDCILGLRQGSGRVWEQACMKECLLWRLQVLQPLVAGNFMGLQHHSCNSLVLLRLQHWLGTAMPGLYLNSVSDESQAMAAAICAFGAPVEQIIVEDQQC